jgi:hypothetical protein
MTLLTFNFDNVEKILLLKFWNVMNFFLISADFGFARFLQDGVMAATLCGSPMYMVNSLLFILDVYACKHFLRHQ